MAHRLMAACMLQLKKYKEALKASERAIAILPDDYWAHVLRSEACQKLKRRRAKLRKSPNRTVRVSRRVFLTGSRCPG